jgi:hypothetical protein
LVSVTVGVRPAAAFLASRKSKLKGIAREVLAARGALMVPAAIEVVARVGIAEQAGQPQAQITGIDRHHDVVLVVDHVLERRQRIAPLAEHRIIDQALLAAPVAAIEGHAQVVAGRGSPVRGLALHQADARSNLRLAPC